MRGSPEAGGYSFVTFDGGVSELITSDVSLMTVL